MKRLIALTAVLFLSAGCSVLGHDAPSNYMVFFGNSNTELSVEARAAVDSAASAIRATHPAAVMIAAGTASGDNLKLAQPRFAVVRDALIADGVAPELIERSAIAEADLLVGATGDQRVEIKLVAKPHI